MSKIFESPDGGKTVYERDVNEPISSRRKVEDTETDDFDVPAWKYIRQDYESYILKINSLIELHEMKFTKTHEDFHKKAYETLITYMHELKAYIKKKEEDYFK